MSGVNNISLRITGQHILISDELVVSISSASSDGRGGVMGSDINLWGKLGSQELSTEEKFLAALLRYGYRHSWPVTCTISEIRPYLYRGFKSGSS